MGSRSNYAIRDRIRQAPSVDTEPTPIDLTVGRRIVSQQTYGISSNERRNHPMYRFASQLEAGNDADIGDAIHGMDLYLRLLSPELMDKIIANHKSQFKRTNTTRRKKLNYYRDIKLEIRDAFTADQSDEPVFWDASMDLELLNSELAAEYRPHIPRSLPLFESDVEFVDYEGEEKLEHAYLDRGPANLLLAKRTKTNTRTGEITVKPILDDGHNQSILFDDLERINDALTDASLLNGRMRGLAIDDLALEIPVFKLSEQALQERARPTMPCVPLGMVSVQALAIWEG